VCTGPPAHLTLGCDALSLIERGRERLRSELGARKPRSTPTDFPDPYRH
jgi:hypothetical protein